MYSSYKYYISLCIDIKINVQFSFTLLESVSKLFTRSAMVIPAKLAFVWLGHTCSHTFSVHCFKNTPSESDLDARVGRFL